MAICSNHTRRIASIGDWGALRRGPSEERARVVRRGREDGGDRQPLCRACSAKPSPSLVVAAARTCRSPPGTRRSAPPPPPPFRPRRPPQTASPSSSAAALAELEAVASRRDALSSSILACAAACALPAKRRSSTVAATAFSFAAAAFSFSFHSSTFSAQRSLSGGPYLVVPSVERAVRRHHAAPRAQRRGDVRAVRRAGERPRTALLHARKHTARARSGHTAVDPS